MGCVRLYLNKTRREVYNSLFTPNRDHNSNMASSSNLHAHRTIGGIETEVVIQSFADSVLVLVTQLGKVGNLVGMHTAISIIHASQLTEGHIDSSDNSKHVVV